MKKLIFISLVAIFSLASCSENTPKPEPVPTMQTVLVEHSYAEDMPLGIVEMVPLCYGVGDLIVYEIVENRLIWRNVARENCFVGRIQRVVE